MSDLPHRPLQRRKRPRVPDTERKRVATACEGCRRVKERCEGGTPCSRCRRLHRECKLPASVDAFCGTREYAFQHDSDILLTCVQRNHETIDHERITLLEDIVTHYAGAVALDKKSLREHLSTLHSIDLNPANSRKIATPSDSTSSRSEQNNAVNKFVQPPSFAYSGDLSHCKFFDSVQNKIDEFSGSSGAQRTMPTPASNGPSRTRILRSQNEIIQHAAKVLPPIEVSRFLVDMFFCFAETNYAYMNETWFRSSLEKIYMDVSDLTVNDSSILCMILMVLALGTQFAHLASATDKSNAFESMNDYLDDMASPDDNVALALYNTATTLLSDVLIIASIESVQALLLLGVYTLPIDAAGLSYTYFGIAVRLAVQNDMHRQLPRGTEKLSAEKRKRIWWTVYALERRISALHGMPVALASTEVDVALPEDILELRTSNATNNLPNFIAIIKLTSLLEDLGGVINFIRQTPSEARTSGTSSLWEITYELSTYWENLPGTVYCKDLAPTGPLFRPNIHLALTYHMIRMYIGRTFIFDSVEPVKSPSTLSNDQDWLAMRIQLVADCLHSALEIIDLCQLLKDNVGLARASYTEFSSCRTAVLVIIARRIQDNNGQFQAASERGLRLLKFMSVGIYSASAEKAAIEAMETVVQRLNQNANSRSPQSLNDSRSAYHNFQTWAKLWSQYDTGNSRGLPMTVPTSPPAAFDFNNTSNGTESFVDFTQTQGMDMMFSNFPLDLDAFNSATSFDPGLTNNVDDQRM